MCIVRINENDRIDIAFYSLGLIFIPILIFLQTPVQRIKFIIKNFPTKIRSKVIYISTFCLSLGLFSHSKHSFMNRLFGKGQQAIFLRIINDLLFTVTRIASITSAFISLKNGLCFIPGLRNYSNSLDKAC